MTVKKLYKKLYVEVAESHLARGYSLMNRKRLASNHGMLFKFPYPSNLSFWMRDTYIPLDVAFIGDDGRVLQIETMSPLSTRAVRSVHLCRYALEVNKGWFDKNNIREGSIIIGEGITGRHLHRKAQMTQPLVEAPPQAPPQTDPQIDPQMALPKSKLYQEESDPDVMLNLDFKTRIKEADLMGKNLTLIYQKKDGYVLPPKIISPPFLIGPDEFGDHDSLVTAWDEQEGQWKSFLIDNILDMEEVSKAEETIIPGVEEESLTL